ncbi:hypothetical protein LC55x_2832 [Lysobacter capsici]|nr:hypothetical protein LC55x_2832 [Lysobacter capsici]
MGCGGFGATAATRCDLRLRACRRGPLNNGLAIAEVHCAKEALDSYRFCSTRAPRGRDESTLWKIGSPLCRGGGARRSPFIGSNLSAGIRCCCCFRNRNNNLPHPTHQTRSSGT